MNIRLVYLIVCGLSFLAVEKNYAQQFTVGLLAGPQAYAVRFPEKAARDNYDSHIKLGYRVGTYIGFSLPKNFSWAAELYYSRKGRKVAINERTFNTAGYNFLELSVLLRKQYPFYLSPSKRTFWFFNVGPNVNYWLNGTGVWDGGVDLPYKVQFGGEPSTDFNVNVINNYNRWLFGIEAGIGVEAYVRSTHLVQVEARFTLGHTYLGDADSSSMNFLAFEDNLKANYRVLSLIVKYAINIDLKNARKGKSTIKRSNR